MLIFPSFFTNITYDDSIQYNFKYGVETILLPELKEDKIDLVFGIEPNFSSLIRLWNTTHFKNQTNILC